MSSSSSSSTVDFGALEALYPQGSDYIKAYGWAAIAGTVILGFGHAPAIADLAGAIIDATQDNSTLQTQAVRKLREALLKASPLVGFPRSINGLSILQKTLRERVPTVASAIETDKSLRSPVSLEERRRRGKDFFSRIYAQHTERILHSMNSTSGGDLGEFAVNCIYGDLVAETSILDAKETGMLEFAACLTLMAAPQAKGHMYGAHNLGNSGDEVRATIKLVERLAKDLGASWTDEKMDFFGKADKW